MNTSNQFEPNMFVMDLKSHVNTVMGSSKLTAENCEPANRSSNYIVILNAKKSLSLHFKNYDFGKSAFHDILNIDFVEEVKGL